MKHKQNTTATLKNNFFKWKLRIFQILGFSDIQNCEDADKSHVKFFNINITFISFILNNIAYTKYALAARTFNYLNIIKLCTWR